MNSKKRKLTKPTKNNSFSYKYQTSKSQFVFQVMSTKKMNKKMNFIIDKFFLKTDHHFNKDNYPVFLNNKLKDILNNYNNNHESWCYSEKFKNLDNLLKITDEILNFHKFSKSFFIKEYKKEICKPLLSTKLKIGMQFATQWLYGFFNRFTKKILKIKSDANSLIMEDLTSNLGHLKINDIINDIVDIEKCLLLPFQQNESFSPYFNKFDSPSHQVNIDNFITLDENIEEFESIFDNIKTLNENNYKEIIFNDNINKDEINSMILQNQPSTNSYKPNLSKI